MISRLFPFSRKQSLLETQYRTGLSWVWSSWEIPIFLDMQLECWTNALSHHWRGNREVGFTGWGLCTEIQKLKCSTACLLQQFNLRKQLLFKQGSSQIYSCYELFSAKIGKTFKVHGDNPLQLFLMQKCNWLEKECFGRENNFCSEFMFSNKEEIALGRSYGKKKSPQTKCVTMLKNCFKKIQYLN